MPYLSIVIPAYNEAERLPASLEQVCAYVSKLDFEVEVLVVDDGSQDHTARVTEEMIPHFPQLRVIANTVNKGKGGAVRQGMLEAKGEYRLFMDADLSTPISELDKFIPNFGKYDILIGSRYLNADSIKVKQPWPRQVISRAGNLMIQWMVLPGIVDTQCGFKVFSAHAAEVVFPFQTMERWSFDVELLTIAHLNNLTIKEIPVEWYDAQGSKLRAVRAAWRSFKDLLQIRRNLHKGRYQEAK